MSFRLSYLGHADVAAREELLQQDVSRVIVVLAVAAIVGTEEESLGREEQLGLVRSLDEEQLVLRIPGP